VSLALEAIATFLWKRHVSNFYSDALGTYDYPNDEDRDTKTEIYSASEDTSTKGEEDHIDADDIPTDDENSSQGRFDVSNDRDCYWTLLLVIVT
jgi:hypothetical protein